MTETTTISFYRPKEVNISEFEEIVTNMREDLVLLGEGEFNEKEVKSIVKKLLDEAKPLKHRKDMLFWGLDEPDDMPSDARVDFFYTPTYLATAFIIQAVLLYPAILAPAETRSKLSKALLACTGREFYGHGYEREGGRIDAIKIFASANTYSFISKYPNLCIDFTDLYDYTLRDIIMSL